VIGGVGVAEQKIWGVNLLMKCGEQALDSVRGKKKKGKSGFSEKPDKDGKTRRREKKSDFANIY